MCRHIIRHNVCLSKEEIEMKRVTVTTLLAILFVSLPGLGQDSQPPETNIHLASLTGNVEAIGHHIKAGSDLNAQNEYGSTPLIVAATFGKTDVARALIEAGADLDLTNNDGATALHTAAFFCHTEIVKALLDKGARMDIKDGAGNTPLESVAAPFEDVRGIYDFIGLTFGEMGLVLDYEHIEATRPKIAEMMRSGS
jgi:hypothetical protein